MNKIQELSQAAIDQIVVTKISTQDWIEQYNKNFVNQVVGECVLAILSTDTRGLVYTTYDRDQVAGIISKVVDSVRDHFKDNTNA